jgi:LssY C-terminus
MLHDRLTRNNMIRSRRSRLLIALILACVVLAGVSVFDSFRFNPDASGDADFMGRAVKKKSGGIEVSASALGARESRRSFGENLAGHGIQPVWLSIENDTDDSMVYLPIAMDPDYYSPYEVSYRFHGAFSYAANSARDGFFLQHQIATTLPPHSHTTGFVYGTLDAGVKYAHVLVAAKDRLQRFDLALPIPGPAYVGANVRSADLYPDQKIENLDIAALREKLAHYPCCTKNSDGARDGDPLNLVVVEGTSDPLIPFIARNWHLTQKLNVASMIETARAFIFRDEYLTSPVSPLYVFGRREDIAIQKARSTINERIHARLWLTPYTFESRRVWLGQISRDIGVRLTDQTWNLTTHKIAPDGDFDRSYLLQDLLVSGAVERYGYVAGVGAAPMSAPRPNLTGDPYFTDGNRLVVFLSNESRPVNAAEFLPWESPSSPADEAR